MRRPNGNPGFVMVIVLLALAVATTALAAAVRASCQRSLRAATEVRNLQTKWGCRSIRDAAIASAEELLARENVLRGAPVSAIPLQIGLGDLVFDLAIGDEQAKLNVNQPLPGGRQGMHMMMRRLQAAAADPVVIRFNVPTSVPKQAHTGAVETLDQFIEYRHPSELLEEQGLPRLLVRRVTCWSDGRANFLRCEREVLTACLAGILDPGQIHELVEFARSNRDSAMEEALRHLQLEKNVLEQAELRLTDQSEAYSLWVAVRGKTRSWHRLTVWNTHEGDLTRSRSFAW
jgi:hypothetical protein